jgi:hypothetical protein
MWRRIATLLVLATVALVAAVNNVSDAVPQQQRAAAVKLMAGATPGDSFDEQVAFIKAARDRILDAAPVHRPIPAGQPRELTDVLRAGHGQCFDRSRAIETILRAYGFEARHIAIYSTAKTRSALKSLVSPGVESHALTEVKTVRGWLLVDSDQSWIGLTTDGKLASLDDLSGKKWRSPPPDILKRPFTYVRGLYSRHGGFYRPYNPIPDVSWPEIVGL